MTVGLLVVFNISPVPQNPEYHNFADQRTIAGIDHFWNVASNLPFIVIGIIAINNLLNKDSLTYPLSLFPCYLIFFIGVGFVGIGSAYYHLQPSNETLLWDRLPMTVGFMAFVAIIIGEYLSEKIARKLLPYLILAGAASVFYWYFTEQAGRGDLRPYGLIQFAPMLMIPMIMVMFPARFTHTDYLWAMLAAYIVAKMFEAWDGYVYSIFGLSGHAIKHLFAAAGPCLFLLALKKRTMIINSMMNNDH